jgi:hypothetical protein
MCKLANCVCLVCFAKKMQAELVRVNAAFVQESCEHRECKAALLARVKVLEADLETAKQTCKDQEYHMQKMTGGGACVDKEREAWAKLKGELGAENEGLRKRMRELEVVEKGWKQVRAIFTTERMPPAGA